MLAYEDVDQHVSNLWTMMALAARYGHQPLSDIRLMTVENLGSFNQALTELIQAENKSGQGHTNRHAEGGG